MEYPDQDRIRRCIWMVSDTEIAFAGRCGNIMAPVCIAIEFQIDMDDLSCYSHDAFELDVGGCEMADADAHGGGTIMA